MERKYLAGLLGLLIGIFGIWGIGHIIAGRWARFVAFFITGVILTLVAVGSLVLIPFAIIAPGLLGLSIVLILLWVVLWIFQAYDAYRCCEEEERPRRRTTKGEEKEE
ncbi:hypothetical protein DRJ16_02615 [Candidatus Woesearchaeota archaeon]|nr:MAG: hypothetical protein DRJ16_02615 [Candidatus Woesearchaeota archaeon]